MHRMPADASTLSATEAQFPAAHEWVASEQSPSPTPGERVADSQHVPQGHSFTRVIIADLKPEVLDQIADADRYEQVCRDLAHLYHYYLHGEHGNIVLDSSNTEDAAAKPVPGRRGKRKSPTASPQQPKKRSCSLPSGQAIPSIIIEHHTEGSDSWAADLADVNDDTESLYLQAQKAQLPFTLTVPEHGTVSGVLWYFPFEHDQETLPLGHHPMLQAAGPAAHMTQLTQAGHAMLTQHTQRPLGTQLPLAGKKFHCVTVLTYAHTWNATRVLDQTAQSICLN